MTPIKNATQKNRIEAYPIRPRIKNVIRVKDTRKSPPLHGRVEFSRQKPDQKTQEHVPKIYITGHESRNHISSPRVCRYPDVSRSRFREELEETFRLLLFRVDQQIARTDSEDENSNSHSRSTIVGANISLSVIHHPSIRIHFIA
jgi:hypothetical protein